jgi:hypothetical protein
MSNPKLGGLKKKANEINRQKDGKTNRQEILTQATNR